MLLRTIDRYIKVYHQFVILQKNILLEKSELYELLLQVMMEKHTRKTIKNIIEDKKYNLKPSQ